MKGQITVEYLISFVIFVGLIAYVYLSYSANLPRFTEEVRKEAIRSQAYQLSEILINNPGKPENWDIANVKRIGLLDERFNKTNLISKAKIEKLNNNFNCNLPNQYSNLKSKLDIDRNFSLMIFSINPNTGVRTPLYVCNPPTFFSSINITLQRIAAYRDAGTINPAEVIIQM